MVADLSWSIHLEDAEVWQRERTVLMVEVHSRDRFANLEASLPRIDGVDVQTIPASNEAGADGQRVLRIGWALFAYTPGAQTLQLPPIRYHLNGRDVTQWQAPAQTLMVQALPPYLPPTIPVGKVAIESRIEPAGWLQPDHLAYWHVRLHSDAVSSAQFPPILKQMQGVDGVEILPAKVERAAQANGVFRLDYQIPFKPQGNGRLALPVLKWHWFDPDSGRLEQVEYQPPRPWVVAWIWRVVLGFTASSLLLAGLFIAGKVGSRHVRQWRSKRKVVQALLQGADLQTVRDAMRACAITHGWSSNFSIGQWLQRWEQRYGVNAALRLALQRLAAEQFGQH